MANEEVPDGIVQPQTESQEVFAVIPLPNCPHVSQVAELPTSGLNVHTKCTKCENVGENWVCLQCYEVNCSRFVEGHAVVHSDVAEHPMALSFADFTVWCYSCNAYVNNEAFAAAKEAAWNSKFGQQNENAAGTSSSTH